MLGFVSPWNGHRTMRLRGTGQSTRSARSISVSSSGGFLLFSAGAGGGDGVAIAGLGGIAGGGITSAGLGGITSAG